MKVYTKTKKAYVFDFDDVLVKTAACVYVIKNGEITRRLSSSEYMAYWLDKDESFDFAEFQDPFFIYRAAEHIMFNTLRNIDNTIQNGTSNSAIYILTARETVVKKAIFKLLISKDVLSIPLSHIITIGDIKDISVSESKKKVLEEILNKGYDVTFFDDDERNIEIANTIPGIKARHVNDDDI
jgi:hypothetical protein